MGVPERVARIATGLQHMDSEYDERTQQEKDGEIDLASQLEWDRITLDWLKEADGTLHAWFPSTRPQDRYKASLSHLVHLAIHVLEKDEKSRYNLINQGAPI